MKYVKKPVVVEAFQFGVDDYPEWFINILSTRVSFHQDYPNCCKLINSREGCKEAYEGDMIIKDTDGRVYPCKKDIFDATYDVYEGEE